MNVINEVGPKRIEQCCSKIKLHPDTLTEVMIRLPVNKSVVWFCNASQVYFYKGVYYNGKFYDQEGTEHNPSYWATYTGRYTVQNNVNGDGVFEVKFEDPEEFHGASDPYEVRLDGKVMWTTKAIPSVHALKDKWFIAQIGDDVVPVTVGTKKLCKIFFKDVYKDMRDDSEVDSTKITKWMYPPEANHGKW